MSIARYLPGTIVLDDRLYVIGGHDGKNVLSSTECFSIKEKTWSQYSPLLKAVYNMGVRE